MIRKSIFKSSWTLDEGLETVRALEKIASEHGWHAALGGGVMKKGASKKDLDVILFPHNSRVRAAGMKELKEELIYKRKWDLYRTVEEMHHFWAEKNDPFHDLKHVEVWKDPKGRRVDFIWMLE